MRISLKGVGRKGDYGGFIRKEVSRILCLYFKMKFLTGDKSKCVSEKYLCFVVSIGYV